MSFILDALKKAGHDEKGETIPGIDSHHEYAEEDEAGFPFLWLLVIGLLLINLLILTWVFWPDASDSNRAESPLGFEPQSSVVEAEKSPLKPVSERGITVREKVLDPVRNPLTERQVVVPPRRSPVAGVSPPPTPSSSVATNASVPDSSSLPTLDQMPATFQSEVPEINYSTHVFAAEPGRRFVMFNGKALSQGERTSDGILVKTIQEQRVILEFQGQSFALDALTNWRLE